MTTLKSGHIVKIMPSDVETYKVIRENFVKNNISHYTYQLKSERAYRVVLRGLHSSEDTEVIKNELSELGHDIRQIINVRHKTTKNPLPLFYVDLEPKFNNKEIFKINRLNYMKISFEAPYKKKEVLQCKRCQRFGHSKNQCLRPYRCVKCGKDHPTTTCLKTPDTDATCANCQEKHPASYKGCIKYQQYRELIVKSKQKHQQPQPRIKENDEDNERPKSNQYIRQNFTYADATNVSKKRNESTERNTNNTNIVEIMDSMFNKLQNLMSKMLDSMMDRMINLIKPLILRCP